MREGAREMPMDSGGRVGGRMSKRCFVFAGLLRMVRIAARYNRSESKQILHTTHGRLGHHELRTISSDDLRNISAHARSRAGWVLDARLRVGSWKSASGGLRHWGATIA